MKSFYPTKQRTSTYTALNGSGDSIVEEILEKWLADWSGLRLYILRRRAGGDADTTMDTLLGELLGLRTGRRDAAETLKSRLLGPIVG